jgi:hypothetical protein
MLKRLLAVLHSGSDARSFTVTELSRELGVKPDEIRLGLLQLERFGLIDRPTTCAVVASQACRDCPIRGGCSARAGEWSRPLRLDLPAVTSRTRA